MRRVLRTAVGLGVAIFALSVGLSLALRHPRWSTAIRTFNKRVLNPQMLRIAGKRNVYAAVIEHTGRWSGMPYRTPILAEPIIDGFIVPLPYGTEVDWLRNAIAAGTATIHRHGIPHRVGELAVVGFEDVTARLSPKMRRRFRFFGIDRFLVAKLVGSNGSHLTVAH